jgi:hypothetical protein
VEVELELIQKALVHWGIVMSMIKFPHILPEKLARRFLSWTLLSLQVLAIEEAWILESVSYKPAQKSYAKKWACKRTT